MTLHTNQLRHIADKEFDLSDGLRLNGWRKEAQSYLTDAANEIDKLRHQVSLLNVQLTFAKKVTPNDS